MELYGRLDVYWPDGPVESFPLDKAEIALGRQSGNDIVLDTTTISRYHVRISHQNGQVFATDLDTVNGTYVDGARLLPNEPRLLKGGEEIQIGDLRAVYQPTLADEMPTAVADAASTTMVADRLSPARTLAVRLESGTLIVTPGAHNQTHLDLQNLDTVEKLYTLSVEGAPNGWARFDRSKVTLDPNERVPIALLVKPLRRSDSLPGDYPLTLRIREADAAADQEIVQPLLLRVRSFSGFGIAFNNPAASASGQFEIFAHNQGNAPLVVNFLGTDAAHKLAVTLEPPQITLQPGERMLVRGQVRLRQRIWSLRPQTYRFDVLAQAQDDSHFLAPISGTYSTLPTLATWGIPVAAPIVAGLLVLILLGLCTIFGLGTLLRSSASPTPIGSPTPALAPLTPFTAVPLVPTLPVASGLPGGSIGVGTAEATLAGSALPTLVQPTSGTAYILPTELPTATPPVAPPTDSSPVSPADVPLTSSAASPPIAPSPAVGLMSPTPSPFIGG